MVKERITNQDDIIDSRDIIERLAELSAIHEEQKGHFDDTDDLYDFLALSKLAEQGEDASPDWTYGATLIRDDHFVTYIEQLIDDCYDMPKEMHSGQWPWCHMTIDYERAAKDAQVDYTPIEFDGVTYWVR